MAGMGSETHQFGEYRIRGAEVTRMDTFVDAAFAFALTLLVISFDEIPTSLEELLIALKATPAFAVSFAQLVMFWLGHRRWSRIYGLESGVTIIFSLTLVFIALVYVFPLRIVYAVFFEWISGGWLVSSFDISSIGELTALFVIYGIGFFAFSLCILLLYTAAYFSRELDLSSAERQLTRAEISGWTILSLTGLASAVLAWALPGELTGWSGMVYAWLGLAMPLNYWWFGLRWKRRQ